MTHHEILSKELFSEFYASTFSDYPSDMYTSVSEDDSFSEFSSDSDNVIISILIPLFFNVSKRKNSPVENAIKERATSGRKAVPFTKFIGMIFRTYGPKIIPVMI